MTLAPTEREYFILFIPLDGPGPEQINRPHKKQMLLRHTTLTDACIHTPAIGTDKHSIVSCIEALCCESSQTGFPALFPGVNMILVIKDLSSMAASIATLLVLLFGSIQPRHKGHTRVNV